MPFAVFRTDHFTDYIDRSGISRLRVECGSSAQAAGNEFTATQTSTAAISPQVMRLVAAEPIDITGAEMTVNVGGVNVFIYESTAGTAGGTFTALPAQTTNLRNPRTPSFSAATGGTFTPSGSAIRQMTVSTGTSGANLMSNTRQMSGVVSLPAGTYYIVTGLLAGVTAFTGELIVTIVDL